MVNIDSNLIPNKNFIQINAEMTFFYSQYAYLAFSIQVKSSIVCVI